MTGCPQAPPHQFQQTLTCLFFRESEFSSNNRKWVSVIQRFSAVVVCGGSNDKDLILSLCAYYCIIYFYESITIRCYGKTKDGPLLWVSGTSEVAIFGFWKWSRSLCLSWFTNLEGGKIRMDKAELTFWGQRVWICGTGSICLFGIQDLECLESIFFSHTSA